MKTTCKIVAAAALALGAASARAGTTSVNFESSADRSIKKLGSYTGTATYDDASGLLTITINNTSSTGARLTGLAFNLDGDGAFAGYVDGDVAGTSADEDAFDDARRRNGKRLVKARPLGNFEAGAALNRNLNAGRKLAERSGIAAGDSHTFSFNVSGGAGLTADDFLGGDLGLVAAFRAKKPDKVGSVIIPASVDESSTGGNNTGGDNTGGGPIIDDGDDLPPIVIPPINTGGGDDIGPGPGPGGSGGNGVPTAVPLPPAAIPALATFAALALPKLKRKLRGTK